MNDQSTKEINNEIIEKIKKSNKRFVNDY